jgi:hypothetical protein
MPLFSYANLTLRSPLWLEELPSVPEDVVAGPPDLRFSVLGSPPPEPPEGDWLHHWPGVGGDPGLSLARTELGLLLRFPGLAEFLLSPDLSLLQAWPSPDTGTATLRHLLLDQVLPRVMAHRGELVLHAGAVNVDGSAVAFVAGTGQGKSTLAGSFHAAGYPLLGDEGLVVRMEDGVPWAHATYPALRLSPASAEALFPSRSPGTLVAEYSDKQRVDLGEEGTRGPLALGVVYVLRPQGPDAREGGVKSAAMTVRDACMALIRHAFLLDPTDVGRATPLLDLATAVAAGCTVLTLSYPRTFDSLPWVRAHILNYLRPSGGVSAR